MMCGHMRISLRRFGTRMPQQNLDRAQIRTPLQKMRSIRMPQRMDSSLEIQAGPFPGSLENGLEGAPGKGFTRLPGLEYEFGRLIDINVFRGCDLQGLGESDDSVLRALPLA